MQKNAKAALVRLLISIFLGIGFGFLCAYFANSENQDPTFYFSALFWTIFGNRVLIGFVVFLVGVHRFHPIFGFRCFSILRGFMMGFLVSLPMAAGTFIGDSIPEDQKNIIFWSSVIMGGIYGSIIDVIASKFGGEGEEIIYQK